MRENNRTAVVVNMRASPCETRGTQTSFLLLLSIGHRVGGGGRDGGWGMVSDSGGRTDE